MNADFVAMPIATVRSIANTMSPSTATSNGEPDTGTHTCHDNYPTYYDDKYVIVTNMP